MEAHTSNDSSTEHFTHSKLQKFWSDVCEVVDKHASDDEERIELIDTLEEFQEGWADNYGVTGTMWENPKDNE